MLADHVRELSHGAVGWCSPASRQDDAVRKELSPVRSVEVHVDSCAGNAMHQDFIARYAQRGRRLTVMGLSVHEMAAEDLHAVIGFLLEQASEDAELLLAQEAPLGMPFADPPSNDGLLEG